MCKCGKSTGDFCNSCSPDSKYNYYYSEECTNCGDSKVKCKKTIKAQCVINTEDLDFLGVQGKDNIDIQTILVSINNALQSLSDADCMEYIRKINPSTQIATYTHSLNFDCIAQTVCRICNDEG